MSDVQISNLILENDILFSSIVEKIGIDEAISLFKKGLEYVELMFEELYKNEGL